MAKLTRYLQKIFANNSNQVGVFGTGVDKETSKNVETLQSADYENGWSSAVITDKNYPIWQEMDGVQYGLSYQLKYLFQNGIPEWLSTETYYADTSYCQYGGKIYQSLQDNNIGHNPALNDGYWTPLLTSNRSIGEIIPSTIPLTEAGLHLLDGALITNGMYADFVTYMANLTATAPECFCTEAQWQTAVTTYGVCGKFVYDSVNNTVRLPKYNSKIYTGGGTAPVVGNGMTLGLTNGTQNGGLFYTTGIYSDVYGQPQGISAAYQGISETSVGVTTDPTKSGIIAQLSNITTSLDGYYYIVIATSTKTDIQVDIDEIATDLNGKADVDLSNCTKPHIVETYVNGASWYRVYSDGWCEQGGVYTSSLGNNVKITVNLLKQYINTNYNICITLNRSSDGAAGVPVIYGNPTTTTFVYMNDGDYDELGFRWQASGYIS